MADSWKQPWPWRPPHVSSLFLHVAHESGIGHTAKIHCHHAPVYICWRKRFLTIKPGKQSKRKINSWWSSHQTAPSQPQKLFAMQKPSTFLPLPQNPEEKNSVRRVTSTYAFRSRRQGWRLVGTSIFGGAAKADTRRTQGGHVADKLRGRGQSISRPAFFS